MKLGIDFGSTRIVVAAVDRGNYPLVHFETPDGSARDWFPPMIAARAEGEGAERRYGWEAWATQAEPGWTPIRSVKRLLAEHGPGAELELGGSTVSLETLLAELTAHLRDRLLNASNMPGDGKQLEIQLGVPANSNANQRYLTAEAFRRGGFEVLGLLNEPTAASLEYASQNRVKGSDDRSLLVYDLGGGTFDASLVEISEDAHSILGTEGAGELGGDDFDDLLAELTLDAAKISDADRDAMSQAEWFRLREECRLRKEALNPSTRKIHVDLDAVREGWPPVSVPVADFYARCRPMVEETTAAVNDLLGRHGYAPDGTREDGRRLEAVYVAGGGSELPLIPRALREQFGRRVRRSAYGRSSTAVGLAVQADQAAAHELRERFTRYFGVWREADHGSGILFDPLFDKGTPLPAKGEDPLEIARRYRPAHNVGHFRYLECSRLDESGRPAGDITLWDEIRFPFDPALEARKNLTGVEVERLGEGPEDAEEIYRCDAGGRLQVEIRNHATGLERKYKLGRWTASKKKVKPGARPKKKSVKRSRSHKGT